MIEEILDIELSDKYINEPFQLPYAGTEEEGELRKLFGGDL